MRYVETFFESISDRNKEVIENNVIGLCVLELMKYQTEWNGTATELLAELTNQAVGLRIDTNSKEWPKAANVLSRRLKELRTNLEETGLKINIARAPGKNVSTITINKITEKAPQSPQHPHPLSPQQNSNDKAGIGDTGHSGDVFARLNTTFEALTSMGDNELVPREAIDRAATRKGIATDIVEAWLTEQATKGGIYSPRAGFWSRIK